MQNTTDLVPRIVHNALNSKSKEVHIAFTYNLYLKCLVLSIRDDGEGIKEVQRARTLIEGGECVRMRIISIFGTILIDEKGSRRIKTKTKSGTIVRTEIKMPEEEYELFDIWFRNFSYPRDKEITINGQSHCLLT